MVVFGWSIYNGATYYIDVFGKRFQKELEQLKNDVAKWQSSPSSLDDAGLLTPQPRHPSMNEFDQIPLLDSENKGVESTGSDGENAYELRERRTASDPVDRAMHP